MKKIIGVLGITVIAMAMFFNTNVINSSNRDSNLVSLISMNTANAEDSCPCYDTYSLNGSWMITKCNGCTQVAHVNKKLDPSTCPCN